MTTFNWSKRWRIRSLPLEWVLEERVGTRKKRSGEGREPNWKERQYFEDPCEALPYFVQNDIRAMGGEYPASAFEPLLEGLMRIERRIDGLEKQFKHHFQAAQDGASMQPPLKTSSSTPANENAPAHKSKGWADG